MNTYTIGSRGSIKQSFEPIGLPLMTLVECEKALALATKKSEFFELAIINTAS